MKDSSVSYLTLCRTIRTSVLCSHLGGKLDLYCDYRSNGFVVTRYSRYICSELEARESNDIFLLGAASAEMRNESRCKHTNC